MFSKNRKKIVAGVMILTVLSFGTMAFSDGSSTQQKAPPEKGPTNLKVLPKNISHEELIKIMHDFCDALDFKCGNCHAASATDPKKLDFASDAKHEKKTARMMMKMMKKINQKNFKIKGGFAENYANAKYEVTCYTCHHGNEHPKKYPDIVKKEK